MNLIKGLNPMQKEAVLTTEGPLLLLAGAGSGKTKVITHRIAYLLENGVAPYNILAITFTNKASKEMNERVDKLVENSQGLWISTFHSTCARILRYEISNIDFKNNFTIYDSEDSDKLIKSILKELNLDAKVYNYKIIMSSISKAKDNLIGPNSYEKIYKDSYNAKIIAQIYKLYQKNLKENNALDFDDIIFKTVELFATRPDILEKYQERFKYVMVDEHQDTNVSQYSLVKMLSGKYKNLCVVGDDDQSIVRP